jgi:hypothetical protein
MVEDGLVQIADELPEQWQAAAATAGRQQGDSECRCHGAESTASGSRLSLREQTIT